MNGGECAEKNRHVATAAYLRTHAHRGNCMSTLKAVTKHDMVMGDNVEAKETHDLQYF